MTATTSTTMSANKETFFFSLFSGVFCAGVWDLFSDMGTSSLLCQSNLRL